MTTSSSLFRTWQVLFPNLTVFSCSVTTDTLNRSYDSLGTYSNLHLIILPLGNSLFSIISPHLIASTACHLSVSLSVYRVPLVVETLGGWSEGVIEPLKASAASKANAWAFLLLTALGTSSSIWPSLYGRECHPLDPLPANPSSHIVDGII